MKKVKRILARVTVILILLSMALFLNGQNVSPTKKIYQDFGTWSLDVGTNKVAIHAYATVEMITKYPTNKYEQKSLEPYQVQRYELYLESRSEYNGKKTSTWIYNARVFINGVEMTKEQFPDGFILSIDVEPTLVYWYETPPVEELALYISWGNAVYETRIR